ncbi:MAG: carboxypeptidase-like regulatory domain-containing protein, partial [Spirosomaceae bacterium]|nr:carboxypeptidase-like regulatory domain-containing protein [Spirosomataceae bacterium]
MNKIKSAISCVFLFFVTNVCVAQLTGRVIDTQQRPLANATVAIENTQNSTKTDENGQFVFKNLTLGNYVLVAFALGKEMAKKNVTVTNSTPEIVFELSDLAKNLDEVIVQ